MIQRVTLPSPASRTGRELKFKPGHYPYPSQADKEAPRKSAVGPGGMITTHGQPNGYGWWAWLIHMFDWTNGCIAVTNEDGRDMGNGSQRLADRD
jgi:hypothetical protein